MIDAIHCADFADGLTGIPDESIDVILTDPPYIGEQYEAAYQVLADHAACLDEMIRTGETDGWLADLKSCAMDGIDLIEMVRRMDTPDGWSP